MTASVKGDERGQEKKYPSTNTTNKQRSVLERLNQPDHRIKTWLLSKVKVKDFDKINDIY